MKTTDSKNRKNMLSLLALALLLFTRFIMLYRAPFAELLTPFFIGECVFFFVAFALNIYSAPIDVQRILTFAGCVIIGIFYALSPNKTAGDVLCPLTYLGVFLFLIERSDFEQKNGSRLAVIWKWVFYAYPVVLLLAFIYSAKKNNAGFDLYVFVTFLLTAAAVLGFGFIKKKKHQQNVIPYAVAAVSVILSGLFLLTKTNVFLPHTLPLLWLVALLIISDKEKQTAV